MSEHLQAGIYQHYTGLLVLVLGLARHSETEDKLVCYVPLGGKAGPRLTVRPLAMFFDEIEIDGAKQPRFRFIGTDMPEDLAEQYRQTTNWGEPEKAV